MTPYTAVLVIVAAAIPAMLVHRRQLHAMAVTAAVIGIAVFGIWRYRSLEHEQATRLRQERDFAAHRQRQQTSANVHRPRLMTAAEIAAADRPAANQVHSTRTSGVLRAPEPDDALPVDTDDPAPFISIGQPVVADVDANVSPPAWLKLASGKQPDGIYRAVVSAEGWDIDQCWREIRMWQIPQAVRSFAKAELGGRWPTHPLDGRTVEALIADSYVEPRYVRMSRNGPQTRHKVYALLDIPASLRDTLIARRKTELLDTRLIYASLAALLPMGVLVVVFGYLKTDDATDGQYTRPLRVVAGLSLVGLAVAGVALIAFVVSEESQFGGFLTIL